MRRSCVAAACLGFLLPGVVEAATWRLQLEPLQVSAVRLDAVYEDLAGVESRGAMRLGLGATLAWRERFELAFGVGRCAVRTDFGLLDGPTARIERADARFELRGRAPVRWRGWMLQGAAGIGRLALRYDPNAVRLDVGGLTFDVQLDDVGTWTRHIAAELLHDLPGSASIVFRTAWSFYELDVATPSGEEKRRMRDLHAGLALRVPVFSSPR